MWSRKPKRANRWSCGQASDQHMLCARPGTVHEDLAIRYAVSEEVHHAWLAELTEFANPMVMWRTTWFSRRCGGLSDGFSDRRRNWRDSAASGDVNVGATVTVPGFETRDITARSSESPAALIVSSCSCSLQHHAIHSTTAHLALRGTHLDSQTQNYPGG